MKTSLWFSWLILAVAIIALCVSFLKCEPIKADWVSIDIGILATITTALIGWQILTVFNLQRTINNLNKDTNYKIQKVTAEFRDALEGEISLVNAQRWFLDAERRVDWDKEIEDSVIDNFMLSLSYFIGALDSFNKINKRDYDDFIIGFIEYFIEIVPIFHYYTDDERFGFAKIIGETTHERRNEIIKIILAIKYENVNKSDTTSKPFQATDYDKQQKKKGKKK